eukprot:UN29546
MYIISKTARKFRCSIFVSVCVPAFLSRIYNKFSNWFYIIFPFKLLFFFYVFTTAITYYYAKSVFYHSTSKECT